MVHSDRPKHAYLSPMSDSRIRSLDTADDSVEVEDPHEWSSEKVSTFVRSLGTSKCFQSVGDQGLAQLLYLGVDVSVFFTLSLNDLPGVCGHGRDDRSLSEDQV